MPVAGKVSVVRVADQTGSAWNSSVKLQGRVDWNFNLDKTEIDAGHMDIDDGWSAFLQGRKNGTLSGTLRYIESDAGQAVLVDNAFSDGDRIWIQWQYSPLETPYSSRGFVTNVNPSPSDEDVTNMSFSIRTDDVVGNSEAALPESSATSTDNTDGTATVTMNVMDTGDDPVENLTTADFSVSIDGDNPDTFDNISELGAVTESTPGVYEVTMTAAAATYAWADLRVENALIQESLDVVIT